MGFGCFYGALIEGAAVFTLLPGGYTYYPAWVLVIAATLSLTGIAVAFAGIHKHNHRGDS